MILNFKIHWSLIIADEDEDNGEDDAYNYKDMINRDERRWKTADQNNDGKLDKEEFANFLHPEEADHMKLIVVEVN